MKFVVFVELNKKFKITFYEAYRQHFLLHMLSARSQHRKAFPYHLVQAVKLLKQDNGVAARRKMETRLPPTSSKDVPVNKQRHTGKQKEMEQKRISNKIISFLLTFTLLSTCEANLKQDFLGKYHETCKISGKAKIQLKGQFHGAYTKLKDI